jgi:hypothetical protein
VLSRLRVLLLAPLAALAVVVGSVPAYAADGGSASTTDVVLYDSCQRHDVTWSASIPAAATFWRLQFQVFGPDGRTSEGYVASSNLTGTSGTFQQSFCGSELPGTWTIQVTGFWQLVPAIPFALTPSTTTFEVRRAATATVLHAHRMTNGRYKVRTAVREEGPSGWFAPSGTDVRLERLVNGQWKPVRDAVLTVNNGRAKARLALPRGTRLRGVAVGAGNYSGSVSDVVRLKKR